MDFLPTSNGDALAHRPPRSSLLRLAIFLALFYLAAWAVVGMITSEKNLLDPAASLFYWRVGFLILFAGLALLWAFKSLRIVSRWLLSEAGIFLQEGTISFRIPVPRDRWNPFLTVRRTDVPLNSIRKTSLSVGRASTLSVETDSGTIEIPSRQFGVGGNTLDSYLRELAGKGNPSGEFKPVASLKSWIAGSGKRTAILFVSLLLTLGPTVVIVALSMVGNDNAVFAASKLFGAPMVAGFCFLVFSATYRGRVALDERGVFYERGGKTTFLSWEIVKEGKVEYSEEALGLWKTLLILGRPQGKRLKEFRIRLNRSVGLGWPLKEIEQAINQARATAKG